MDKVREQFPIFKNNPELAYLDATATTLKPQSVLDKIQEYYTQYSANIHRGIYKISEVATVEYEQAREILAQFIGAGSAREIIFTRGTTEGINLLAHSLGEEINEEDEIVISLAEHHSNLVPWQQLTQRKGASLRVLSLDKQNCIIYDEKNFNKKTKILAITAASNVTGNLTNIVEVVKKARQANPNIKIVVDGAQLVAHRPVQVADLDVDFMVFSGHKMYGPSGIGVLWGKLEQLEALYPYHFGGEMVNRVTIDHTEFKSVPQRFEAGTPPIAQAIGLGAAAEFIKTIGFSQVIAHEIELKKYLISELKNNFDNRIKFVSQSEASLGIVAFNLQDVHPHDVAQVLDEVGVCVRVGQHCAQPLHDRLGLLATVRASLAIYNNKSDIDKLISGIVRVQQIL